MRRRNAMSAMDAVGTSSLTFDFLLFRMAMGETFLFP
jgi:hypothetical protein